jgi:hypothetical protein
MNYIPTDELIDPLKELTKKPYIDAPEVIDLITLAIQRIESLTSQVNYMRNRSYMAEHIVGQLYIQNYEYEMEM